MHCCTACVSTSATASAVTDFQQLPLQGRLAQSLTRREVQRLHIAQRIELITTNKCKD